MNGEVKNKDENDMENRNFHSGKLYFFYLKLTFINNKIKLVLIFTIDEDHIFGGFFLIFEIKKGSD